jgi:hypothetical protein
VRSRRWDSLEETKFNTPSDFKISESMSDLGVWPVVLSEVEKRLEKFQRERKRGEVIKSVGPITVII